jgi:cytochrome P450
MSDPATLIAEASLPDIAAPPTDVDPLADRVSAYYRGPADTDPTALYADLRGSDELVRTDFGFVVVGRHADALTLLRDERTVRVPPAAATPGSEVERLFRYFFTTVDRDTHRRMRRLVQRSFTPRAVAALTRQIQDVVDALLGAATARVGFDFVEAVAEPVPATVFSALLGFPVEDRTAVATWVNALLGGYHPGASGAGMTAEEAAGALLDYVRALVRRRRAAPATDLLSSLIEVHDEGEALSEDELVGATCHMLHAGIETTVTLLGSVARVLVDDPTVGEVLRVEPDLAGAFVEECLRLHPPVVSSPMRKTLADVRLSNGVVREGETFTVWIGAANRDPAVFDRPDELDLRRRRNPHLTFSIGDNVCLGAHLSRLEGRVMATAVAEALADYEIAGPLTYRDVAVVRALDGLPLRPRRRLAGAPLAHGGAA